MGDEGLWLPNRQINLNTTEFIFLVLHKHNILPLGQCNHSSPSTKELHSLCVLVDKINILLNTRQELSPGPPGH